MAEVRIRRGECSDAQTAAELASRVYSADAAELAPEFESSMARADRAVFLAESGGAAVGMIDLATRYDYVNGCDSSPVAFVEGVYVAEEFRRAGVARKLVAAAEQWAKERGLKELASDRLLENELSEKFHLGCGFEETERVVYYRKKL